MCRILPGWRGGRPGEGRWRGYPPRLGSALAWPHLSSPRWPPARRDLGQVKNKFQVLFLCNCKVPDPTGAPPPPQKKKKKKKKKKYKKKKKKTI
jgi:hypothetical protein